MGNAGSGGRAGVTQRGWTDLELGQHPRALRRRAWNNLRLVLDLLKPRDAPLLDARRFLGYLRVVTKHILKQQKERADWLKAKNSPQGRCFRTRKHQEKEIQHRKVSTASWSRVSRATLAA